MRIVVEEVEQRQEAACGPPGRTSRALRDRFNSIGHCPLTHEACSARGEVCWELAAEKHAARPEQILLADGRELRHLARVCTCASVFACACPCARACTCTCTCACACACVCAYACACLCTCRHTPHLRRQLRHHAHALHDVLQRLLHGAAHRAAVQLRALRLGPGRRVGRGRQCRQVGVP